MFVPTMTRFLVATIALVGFMHVATARPLHHSSGLSKRDLADASALLEREFSFGSEFDLDARLFEDVEELLKRAPNKNKPAQTATRSKGTPKQERGAAKAPQQKTNAAPAKKPPHQNPPKHKPLPNNTKIRLSDDARSELNKMGLHGKDRRKEIKNQKSAVKKEMRKQGAVTAEIKHVAHKGGSDPKEKNHVTASLYAKKQPGDTGRNGKVIPNTKNGGPNHHIYLNNKGTSQASKKARAGNDADIRGQSKQQQVSVSKTPTAGKSSTKGKGKQHAKSDGFSKNDNKGIKRR